MGILDFIFGKGNPKYFEGAQGGGYIPPYEKARKGETKKEKLERQRRNLQMKFHEDKWSPIDGYNPKREARMKKKYGKNYIPNYDLKLWNKNFKNSDLKGF